MTERPFDVTIQVAEVTDAEPFPGAHKPQLVKLQLDLGDESLQSAAQLGYHYDVEEHIGKHVLCATNLGSVRITGFKSEALTVGVPGDDGNPVLVTPDKPVRSVASCTNLGGVYFSQGDARSRLVVFTRGPSVAGAY